NTDCWWCNVDIEPSFDRRGFAGRRPGDVPGASLGPSTWTSVEGWSDAVIENGAVSLLADGGGDPRTGERGGGGHRAPTQGACRAVSALALVVLLGQLRGEVEQVTHHTEVGDLEDRRRGVLVHRDERLRGLHARTGLNRAGDAERHVELRRHGLTGLSDLELGRVVPGVHRRTGGTDGRTERVGQLLHDLELLRGTDTTATRDHDRGLGQLGAVTGDDRLDTGDL